MRQEFTQNFFLKWPIIIPFKNQLLKKAHQFKVQAAWICYQDMVIKILMPWVFPLNFETKLKDYRYHKPNSVFV